jgi:NADH-quinone oxidoreductase subunit N
MWVPDVYEGAPTPATAFFSVGPKAAGFALLIRFFYSVLADKTTGVGEWVVLEPIHWNIFMMVISAITMTVGNLCALSQQNVKRMLAYSSIAHAGYILMGFIVLNNVGLIAMLYYILIYAIMNLGAFFVVSLLRNEIGSEMLEDYKGLVWRSPFLVVAMAVFLFSLVGLPPLAGFVAKFYLFAALIQNGAKWQGFYWLALIGVINTVISLYYYAKVLKAMVFEKPTKEGEIFIPMTAKALLTALFVPIIILGIYWSPIFNIANRSSDIIFYSLKGP